MIQFACPSCKSPCSVGDQFKGRKIKCPRCGARVVHVRDAQVELLTAGTVQPKAPAAPPPPGSPPSELTPVATAVVPHSVGDFVGQSESKQNLLIGGGLLIVFTAALSFLGILIDKPILVVAPIGVALTIAAVWLWLRKKRHEEKLRAALKDKMPPVP